MPVILFDLLIAVTINLVINKNTAPLITRVSDNITTDSRM
jgi:hypothetical protein